MGRKVHPIGFRLGINKPWLGRWYAEGKDYTNHLHQDLEIRKLVKKEADRAGVSDIEIERYPGKVKDPANCQTRHSDRAQRRERQSATPAVGSADRQED